MFLWVRFFSVVAWVFLAHALTSRGEECVFRAAVYESAFRLSDPDPVQTMQNNLDVFQGQVQLAAKQGAEIIVFPEMGITGLDWDSEQDLYYQEVPPLGTIPCLTEDNFNQTLVVHQLSCMARESSIFVVANFASSSPCDDASCPSRGSYHYNTDAAFDASGTLLAVYHKLNLYGEPEFDAPPTTEHVFFDAPFGRVGMITCFDLLWLEPTVTLVEEDRVDTVAFPTAWMDQLPYLASIQAQAAWAAGLNVNLLAANMHFPIEGFMGSGLYAGLGGPISYIYDAETNGSLIVNDLPCSPSNNTAAKLSGRNADAGGAVNYHYIKYEDMSPFASAILSVDASSALLCQDTLCCGVDYGVVEDPNPNGHYALVVHRGNVSEGDLYTYGAEICSVLWCEDEELASCTRQPSNVTAAFGSLELWGNFSTPYVYPSLLTDRLQLALPDSWHFDQPSDKCEELVGNGTCAGLQIVPAEGEDKLRANAVSLYGRLYALDVI